MSKASLYKLYIYIPTFNREVELEAQLKALKRALERINSSQVFIHVNDNNSTYPTENIQSFCLENDIYYTKNPANLGGNANILLGFINAHSAEYLWILSDNDLVTDNSLVNILSALNNNPDFLFASSITSKSYNTFFDYNKNILDLLDNRAGLISSTIYSLKVINNNIFQSFFFHNSSFPHLGVILSTLKEHKSVSASLLPYGEILAESIEIDENKGDYRLAYLGFPMLAELLDDKHRRLLINGWFDQNGLGFFKSFEYNRYLYYASLKSILTYGNSGTKAKAIFFDLMKHLLPLARRALRFCKSQNFMR